MGCVQAAAPEQSKRPKIALVLEGGGALGLAHIGVLQWMEAHHIPIDAVVGTSMGGLVGGLYASGKSPQDIQEVVQRMDWPAMLSGQTRFRDLSFRRKEDQIEFQNRLDFGLKGGVRLPSGLNAGQDITFFLNRQLINYTDMKSFDDLPTQFRCVAADLISGDKKVFDLGSLPLALRATMSIPGVFEPIRIGKEVYTDGGSIDNLPVDVAKTLKPDIVIAVYLDPGSPETRDLTSLLDIAGRNISMMIIANELQSMKAADILLTANLKGLYTSDYQKAPLFISRGEAAAERKAALLSRFAVDDATWEQFQQARQSRTKAGTPAPQKLIVDTTNSGVRRNVEFYAKDLVGKPINVPELERALAEMRGQGSLSSLDYRFRQVNGSEALIIRPVEKANGPPFLNLGILIDGSDSRDIRFGLAGRLTFLNIGGLNSEIRANARIGREAEASLEYYHPFTPESRWFIAPHAYATSRLSDLYVDNTRLAEFTFGRSGVGADIGYRFGRRAEFRIGEDIAVYSTSQRIGTPVGQTGSQALGVSTVRFRYYGQDDVPVPRTGTQLEYMFQWFTGRPAGGGFPLMELRAGRTFRLNEPSSIYFNASGGSTFGASNTELQSFALGGPRRLSAYGRNELLGNQYFLGQAGYIRRLTILNPIFAGPLYGVVGYEIGKVYGPFINPSLPNDFEAFLIAKTRLGPIFAGTSYGDSGHHRWFFGVGRVF